MVRRSGERIRVSLSESLTVKSVEDEKARLQEAFGQHDSIEIDCSGVLEADLSGVQLIVSALKAARRDNKRVEVIQPASGVFLHTVSRAGLTDVYDNLCAPEGSPNAKGSNAQ